VLRIPQWIDSGFDFSADAGSVLSNKKFPEWRGTIEKEFGTAYIDMRGA